MPERSRKLVIYWGNRPVGHGDTGRFVDRPGKADKYCAVNAMVGSINPKHTLEQLREIGYEFKNQVENMAGEMGVHTMEILLFREGTDSKPIDEDEYQKMKEYLNRYNERSRKALNKPNFSNHEHVFMELLICGGGTELPIEPTAPMFSNNELPDCEECDPVFHSLYILDDEDFNIALLRPRAKLFKVGGWRQSTTLMPL